MDYRKHQKNVRELGCCVCRNPVNTTYHHCKSGSMTEWFGYELSPGTGQKQNEFLGIPLCWHHHVFDQGVDSGMGVITWEGQYGTQVYYLRWVNKQLEYDIWEESGVADPYAKLEVSK